jgi:hypothetical protein
MPVGNAPAPAPAPSVLVAAAVEASTTHTLTSYRCAGPALPLPPCHATSCTTSRLATYSLNFLPSPLPADALAPASAGAPASTVDPSTFSGPTSQPAIAARSVDLPLPGSPKMLQHSTVEYAPTVVHQCNNGKRSLVVRTVCVPSKGLNNSRESATLDGILTPQCTAPPAPESRTPTPLPAWQRSCRPG